MADKTYYVYILTNRRNTVLYTGVTNSIERRFVEHNEKVSKTSFAAKYNLDKLVYCEETADVRDAIAREKEIKGWVRRKKVDLIERANPEWKDLL